LQTDLLKGEPAGRIGIDEAGKGDYFGPLVIASFYSDDKIDIELARIGLKESKKISDSRTFVLEKELKKIGKFETVVIGPEKYNELRPKFRNLNKLLAWGHARVLENLLTRTNPIEVVADQFGDKKLIEKALFSNGKTINLIQMHKAEIVPAVAAASVIARAEFLRRLRSLSSDYNIELKKGAGPPVDNAGRLFIRAHGREKLGEVAKLHFKNTQRVDI